MKITVINKTISRKKPLNETFIINSLKMLANVIQKIETFKQIHLKKNNVFLHPIIILKYNY